jgi:DNA-binding transcriptional ArsR family regulator
VIVYHEGFRRAASCLNALGDPTRRAIFERLAGGPLPVVEIARTLPVTRPAVSHHLKDLKEAGLVLDRRNGTRRVYEVDHKGLVALRSYIDRFWTDSLVAFRRVADETYENEKNEKKERP